MENLRVLLITDRHPDFLTADTFKALAQKLSDGGYTVCSGSYEDALLLVEDFNIDAIISTISADTGTIFDLMQALQNLEIEIPVLALSMSQPAAESVLESACALSGTTAFLSLHNYSADELYEHLNRLILDFRRDLV